MLKEFKEFISRGSVIDLAVGIIIGAAFTAIVNSLVNDIIMPPIGLLLGGIDFSNFFITLKGTPQAMLRSFVLVSFIVDRNGRVVQSSVYRTNGDDEAEATALASLRRAAPLPAPVDTRWAFGLNIYA